ncbi:MAG: DUF1217 domain-containing protein [Rhodobacteraceae bacterium]|nr:MAG: DUF1217 domain-containing protein [Paracoccaceae bacterium]
MSFQPIVPISGLAGWAFLKRTQERQETVFNKAPMLTRQVDEFARELPKVKTAEELVGNRRLLQVALGAFGLQDDINNRAFIRKIVEDGTTERGALANRLSDKRYLEFAKAFSYLTNDGPAAPPDGFAERLIGQFRSREFEIAVGEQDNSMRLALALQRDLPQLAEQYTNDRSRWFAILGNPPMREVLQTSLGLPKEFGKLDIDSQVTRMQSAAQRRFGTSDLVELGQPENLEKITQRFLVLSQLRETQTMMSGASTALMLLQSARGLA